MWLKSICHVVELAFNLRSDCICLLWIRHFNMVCEYSSIDLLLIMLRDDEDVSLFRIPQQHLYLLQLLTSLEQLFPEAHVHG